MAKEEKDGLFDTNLGGGLIELNDEVEESTEGTSVGDTEKEKKKETPVSSFVEHEDGTIEVDTALQATIDAGNVKAEEDDDNIEKTEDKQDNGKAPSDGNGSDDSSPSSSQYLAFARDRANEGTFLDFNEEDWKVLKERNNGDEAAALRELSDISVQQRIIDGVEAYKESLTDQDRALYEAKEKGVPIDKYGLAQHEFNKWSKVKTEDLKENEKLQVEVVSKGLELKGFTKDEISEAIEDYKALENLESKAEKILPLLPKRFKDDITAMEESAAAEDQSRKDKIRQSVAKMKQMVETVPEIIPGIKLNKQAREKIMKSMSEPVARDAAGNPLNEVMQTRAKNPDGFEMTLHYYHSLGLFNMDESGQIKPDFSKITKIAKTEATDTMRSIFESKEKQVGGKPRTVKTEKDELDEFDAAFGRIGKR